MLTEDRNINFLVFLQGPAEGLEKERNKEEQTHGKPPQYAVIQKGLQFGFLFASHPHSEHFSHILKSSALPDFANKIQDAQLNLNFRKAENASSNGSIVHAMLGIYLH